MKRELSCKMTTQPLWISIDLKSARTKFYLYEILYFISIWLEISINWHIKSQGPKKKCTGITRERIHPRPAHIVCIQRGSYKGFWALLYILPQHHSGHLGKNNFKNFMSFTVLFQNIDYKQIANCNFLYENCCQIKCTFLNYHSWPLSYLTKLNYTLLTCIIFLCI